MRLKITRSLLLRFCLFVVFFFNDTATTEIYTLSLHDALPISGPWMRMLDPSARRRPPPLPRRRSEEHTSELQSRFDLVCRLLLEKQKKYKLVRSLYRFKHLFKESWFS